MKIGFIAAGVAAILIIITGMVTSVYRSGIQAERTAALTKGVELVKERDKLNVQVRSATGADICRRLGGQWLPDTNECG